MLLPSLYLACPWSRTAPANLIPNRPFNFIAKHGVRNAFMPPTALKLMRQVENPRARHSYAMRSIGSGGEVLGEDILEWCRATFGFDINEFYGQTEATSADRQLQFGISHSPWVDGAHHSGPWVEVVSSKARCCRTEKRATSPSIGRTLSFFSNIGDNQRQPPTSLRVIGVSPAIPASKMTRATSGTRAARMISSAAAATALGRRILRIA